MKTWLCAIATLFLLMSPVKAQETFIVPLSKKADNTISLELLCQKDGRVGPFINISRLPPTSQRSAHIFSGINVIKNVDFFESNEQNVISFPVTWTYADGPSGTTGFFISTADFSGRQGQKFSERIRSITNDSQIYVLQFLSSRYVGLEFNGKRYLTEIDLNTVSNAAIADCLKFAGYDAALAAVKAQLKGALDKEETKQLCLQTFGYARSLEEYRPLLKAGDARLKALVPFPFESRAECFSAGEKDRPRILAAYLAGAEQGLALDYVGLGGAAQAAEIPTATLLMLKKDWGGGKLPEVMQAERSKEKDDTERKLKYVYTLYARIKSCEEAFGDGADKPFTRGELDKYRGTMSQLSSLYAPEFSSEALWTEASADYPAMLSKMRYSIGVDSRAAAEGCARNAGVFEGFAGKLVGQATKPKKDF